MSNDIDIFQKDTYLGLLNYYEAKIKDRRQHQWRLNISLWTGLAISAWGINSSNYMQNNPDIRDPFWIALFVLWACYHIIWRGFLQTRFENDHINVNICIEWIKYTLKNENNSKKPEEILTHKDQSGFKLFLCRFIKAQSFGYIFGESFFGLVVFIGAAWFATEGIPSFWWYGIAIIAFWIIIVFVLRLLRCFEILDDSKYFKNKKYQQA